MVFSCKVSRRDCKLLLWAELPPWDTGLREHWGQWAGPGEGVWCNWALRMLCWSLQVAKARLAPAEKQKVAVVENGERLSSSPAL